MLSLPATATPSIWASCAQPDLHTLDRILSARGWLVRGGRSVHETLSAFRQRRFDAVICDEELPDGSWRDLLAGLSHLASAPPLIVLADRHDSSLWAEVFNLGGFDVLLRPLKEAEICRLMDMARRQHGRRKYAASVTKTVRAKAV